MNWNYMNVYCLQITPARIVKQNCYNFWPVSLFPWSSFPNSENQIEQKLDQSCSWMLGSMDDLKVIFKTFTRHPYHLIDFFLLGYNFGNCLLINFHVCFVDDYSWMTFINYTGNNWHVWLCCWIKSTAEWINHPIWT